MHRSQEDLITLLAPRIARLLTDGDQQGQYADDRTMLMAILGGAANVGFTHDEMVRVVQRDPSLLGARWWHQHPDKVKATLHVGWMFGMSVRQTSGGRATYRARTGLRMWVAAHAWWLGKTGDSEYRAFVALIAAAHDRGGSVFRASERILCQYAILSRTTLRAALDQLVAQGIVKRTKIHDGSPRYELHEAGWKVLSARTPAGVERHPDERSILLQYAPCPVAQFRVPVSVGAQVAPLEHSSSTTRDTQESSNGTTCARRADTGRGTGSASTSTGLSADRGWTPCHPAFGYGRLDQCVFLVLREHEPLEAALIAAITGYSVRVVRDKLGKLVEEELAVSFEGEYRRAKIAPGLLDQIAHDNGGLHKLHALVKLAEDEQTAYQGELDPAGVILRLSERNRRSSTAFEVEVSDTPVQTAPAPPTQTPLVKKKIAAVKPTTKVVEVSVEHEWSDDAIADALDGLDLTAEDATVESWQDKHERLRNKPAPDEDE